MASFCGPRTARESRYCPLTRDELSVFTHDELTHIRYACMGMPFWWQRELWWEAYYSKLPPELR